MNKLYEEWIDPKKVFEIYEKNHSLDYYTTYVENIYKTISYFNKLPSQLKFFDFGMGWGSWCLMAKAFGIDAYGTELSQSRIKNAESFGVKVLTWEEIKTYKFDFINLGHVCEHIPEPLSTIKYLKNSLKQGGLIKISVPNGSDIKKRLKTIDWNAEKGSKTSLNIVSPLEHINCFNTDSMIKMADLAGLSLINLPIFPKLELIKSPQYVSKKILKQIVKKVINYKDTDLYFRLK